MDEFSRRLKYNNPAGRPSAALPVDPKPAPPKPVKRWRLAKPSRQTALRGLVVLILIAALAVAGLFYGRYQAAQAKADRLSKASSQTPSQIQQLVARIGKLTALPAGETPTLAAITDVSKLAGQPFFAHAQNGDDVLIYNQAKMAYLFRPSTNQIINIAPVTTSGATQPSSPSTGQSTSTTATPLVTPAGGTTTPTH